MQQGEQSHSSLCIGIDHGSTLAPCSNTSVGYCLFVARYSRTSDQINDSAPHFLFTQTAASGLLRQTNLFSNNEKRKVHCTRGRGAGDCCRAGFCNEPGQWRVGGLWQRRFLSTKLSSHENNAVCVRAFAEPAFCRILFRNGGDARDK